MAETGTCERNGYTISWRLGGRPDGTPLVLLHSLGTHSAMWQPQERAFADRRLLLLDWPGHGASTLPPAGSPITIAGLGDDVVAVLDALGWDQVDVLGLSLGGMVGLTLAARRPCRVRRLVASNCAARIADTSILDQRIRRIMADGMASIATDVIAGWFSTACLRRRPALAIRARQWLCACPSEAYVRTARAVCEADLRPDLQAIACPVTIISATCDRPTPPDSQRELAAAITGSRLHTVQAAHLANLEKATAYNAIVGISLLAPGGIRGASYTPEMPVCTTRITPSPVNVDGDPVRPAGD